MNKIDDIYCTLLNDLLQAPIVNNDKINGTAATSGSVFELNNVTISLDDITQNIISLGRISPAYLFGEWLWYFTGRQDMKFISCFGKIWKQMSDDGITNNSAYGHIMMNKFGFDQIEKIIELLKIDPDSRRAVININVPNKNVIETKDEPCTIALQFLVRKNKLHCTCMMRSNDIWLGFPYDVAFFTELQKYVADILQMEYGTYTHFVVSLHLYERNVNAAKKIINEQICEPVIFDRHLFHINKYFVGDMIEVASKHCTDDFVKHMMIDMAKQYFGYDVRGGNK